jgi:ABC-2 type transport system permease protein
MQVFKAYFKIIKKNLPQMFIYLGIFAGMSIAFANLGVGKMSTEFVDSKPGIAVFSDDDTVLVDGLHAYLGEVATIVPIEDTQDARQDALFFRKVSYIIEIPAGFTESLLGDKKLKIRRTMVPDSYEATYTDYLISKYCTAVSVYSHFVPGITQEEIVANIAADFKESTNVTVKSVETNAEASTTSVYFFNYFAYSLFAIIMLGVSSFMITFQNSNLRRRNTASPMSLRSMNTQLVLGNTVFALATWLLLYGLAFLMYGKSLYNVGALYYAVNTLAYTLVCVAISFLVGNLTQSRGAQAAIVNVLSLGLSFISGVFVPQFMLGEGVLKIARFLPTYWFVHANLLIDEVDLTAGFSIQFMMKDLGMQMVFVLVLFTLAAVIVRRKRTSDV